ncbi:hypothetical protein ACWEWF_46565, partial [Streptomyces sp. NPDC003857]
MTISATGRGLDQFRGDIPIYTLTFAKGLSPTELLTRMGVDPDTLALRDPMDLHDDFGDTLYDEDEPVVTTGTDGAWTWAPSMRPPPSRRPSRTLRPPAPNRTRTRTPGWA